METLNSGSDVSHLPSIHASTVTWVWSRYSPVKNLDPASCTVRARMPKAFSAHEYEALAAPQNAMARPTNKLSVKFTEKDNLKPGLYGDGGGLYRITRAGFDVFSQDAPGILHRPQYGVLIGVVHVADLTTDNDSIRPTVRSYAVWPGARRPETSCLGPFIVQAHRSLTGELVG